MMANVFPLCVLHGHNIVHEFPRGCPLGSRDALAHLITFRDRSYPGPDDDAHNGEMFGALYETCNACASRLLSNLHVKYLRRKRGLTSDG